MERIGFEFCKAARRHRRLMDGNLGKQGLSAPQIHVLGYLDMKRERGEPCTQTDVRRECCNTRSSSVTSLLQGLEKDGYIFRESGADARVKKVLLTEKGVRVARECKKFHLRVDEALIEGFTAEEKAQFENFLVRAAENLARFSRETEE